MISERTKVLSRSSRVLAPISLRTITSKADRASGAVGKSVGGYMARLVGHVHPSGTQRGDQRAPAFHVSRSGERIEAFYVKAVSHPRFACHQHARRPGGGCIHQCLSSELVVVSPAASACFAHRTSNVNESSTSFHRFSRGENAKRLASFVTAQDRATRQRFVALKLTKRAKAQPKFSLLWMVTMLFNGQH